MAWVWALQGLWGKKAAFYLGEQEHMELRPAVDDETVGSLWVTDERAEQHG